MIAGLLNEHIKILTPNIVTNDFGEGVETYILKTSTKANVIHAGSSKNLENGELFFGMSKIFKVRKYVTVDHLDIIEWNNNKYKINAIEDDKIQQCKIITCTLINE